MGNNLLVNGDVSIKQNVDIKKIYMFMVMDL